MSQLIFKFHHVFKYFGTHPILENVSLTISRGQRIALIGENGVGKSTLIKMLMGFESTTHGVVDSSKSINIGYVPQSSDAKEPLSGGQIQQKILAETLRNNPDVLILDEPTNHLDQTALTWLSTQLNRFKGTLILICHDRAMIESLNCQIWELHSCKIKIYGSKISNYLEEKENEKMRLLKEYEQHFENIKELKQLIKYKSFNKKTPKGPTDNNQMAYDKRGEKHQKSIQRIIQDAKNRLSQLESIKLDNPYPKGRKGIHFNPKRLRSNLVLSIHSWTKEDLFHDVNLEVLNGDRIVLSGDNGCGKTTFFKTLLNQLSADSGKIKWSPTAVIGYLDQLLDQTDDDESFLNNLKHRFPLIDHFKELQKFGILTNNASFQTLKSLSLGQKKKWVLLNLMLQQCNILLLDEPTNHLDWQSMDELEKSLLDFDGAIIAITHDHYFINRIANRKWRMANHHIEDC
ncbi:MAG: ABC-F family ATP-binding cassette domain-containing protein [Parachlamydiales bacterium]|nr:ABC-F family ATP-binding cassette domain-containing protein [Parachlamydiales bacterium]